ncbi:uroporphyrinogen-III synthase [Roseicella aquatilis]|uniref:Uroporphyrinogen-III synthase n=1 Tax=Roseicella aquatilis TaxID=2527868 RepID=A0A4R4D3W1_9PROT|nr:uroporphyrinogen-III synthase [Roseicella aquatilis]TCZ54660.1 uroporphyrinogen-III synthase [Roseicella aquatilis]
MASGVLVTRPEPGAAETARRVAALGWRPILAPALVLAPRPFAMPPAQALLLTSRAAARALPPADLPVLAVGEATAAEARARGFPRVEAAAGDAAALAAQAGRSLDPAAGPLLLAVGRGYGAELAADLRARGFRVVRRVAYAAAPAPALPEAACAALRDGEVVATLFFSPRSARCAMSLLKAAGLAAAVAGTEALAISPRVAEAAARAIAPLAWRAVRIADRPDQDALLALLGPR